jgi:type I site-specific restriction endonuclease
MPYFVYEIHPMRIVRKVAQHDKFKDASAQAKEIRNKLTGADNYSIKVIFAENELHAEEMLGEVREKPPTTGEDY